MGNTIERRIDLALPMLTPDQRRELNNGATWHERNGRLGLLSNCGWFTPVEPITILFPKKTERDIKNQMVKFAKAINKLTKQDDMFAACIKEVFYDKRK